MNAVSCALAQLDAVRSQVAGVDPAACDRLVDELQTARRIFVCGAGRSLLAMKMFAMRLMQTNHDACLVGEVCTRAIGRGDLLLASSGGGETKTTLELVRKARLHGARTAVVTANPSGSIAAECDVTLAVPPTPAPDADDSPETAFMKQNLPGNFFETACILVCDGLIARVMERESLGHNDVMHNHANLE